jgi:hypothetical protein
MSKPIKGVSRENKQNKNKRRYKHAAALPYRGNRPSRKQRDKHDADVVKDARK